jgi:hypothetical protein
MWLVRRIPSTDVFLVGFDPVGRYLVLGGLQVQFALAHELVQFPLERILYKRVPGRGFGRLGPKVANGIGSSQ